MLRPKLNSHFHQASIIYSPEGTAGPNDFLIGLATDAIKLEWSENVTSVQAGFIGQSFLQWGI